jgi:hypothetical protein
MAALTKSEAKKMIVQEWKKNGPCSRRCFFFDVAGAARHEPAGFMPFDLSPRRVCRTRQVLEDSREVRAPCRRTTRELGQRVTAAP